MNDISPAIEHEINRVSQAQVEELKQLTSPMLMSMDIPIPRYTSYPTAPEWGSLDEIMYRQKLHQMDQSDKSLSVYCHIPFCHSMCLYCGCSVVLNRKPENEERYVRYLLKEIAIASDTLNRDHPIEQLHFGGGTPTKLSSHQIEQIFTLLDSRYGFTLSSERTMEIDPRTVYLDEGKKLMELKKIGFNRVSFGVQDTNEKVQEAVRRRQSYEMTCTTFERARNIGFDQINIDLIYGLPLQTEKTFSTTIQDIIALSPDRIALFSYAQVPWMKPHQKAIPSSDLPSSTEKFKIYLLARQKLLESGYIAIGMDHFAKKTDSMVCALVQGQLKRNFQGYTVLKSENLLPLGVSSIGYIENGYFQNTKDISSYYAYLDANQLPIVRGKILSQEDLICKWVIHTLMCQFKIDKALFLKRYQRSFDAYFIEDKEAIMEMQIQGLVRNTEKYFEVIGYGKLFIRNVVSIFDRYLKKAEVKMQFSRGI